MAMKKYIVRDGFVVLLEITQPNGDVRTREFASGEELQLDDADAARHAHKLEFASLRDREAALAAEQAAVTRQAAGSDPAALISQLVAALAMAQQQSTASPSA